MAKILWVEKQIDYEPQGIMSMSAILKEAGHDVQLTIAAQEDPVQFAKDYQPDIVGYSVMTGSQYYYFKLNNAIRVALNGHTPMSIFGGPHSTFFPNIIQEDGVDGVCVGEGEGPVVDLANTLDNGGFQPDIPNWWFKVDGEIIRNPVRPLIRKLDDLPMPDRDLIYSKHAPTRNSPIKHFMTSRGCPYSCTYCFNHAWYKIYKREKRGYQRSVESMIEEVNLVKEHYPLEQVVFLDDLFIIYVDWLEEFAEKFPKEVGLPFFCNVRSNLITPEKVDLLKKAGANTVSVGIESGNDRIRNDLLKRRMSRETIIETGRMLHDVGINLTSTNILALPTATLDDDLETMRLNTQAKVKYAHAFLFQPYPATELGEFTEKNGHMVGSFEDIGAIAWDSSILVRDADEKRHMENLQRWFAIGTEFPRFEPIIRMLIKLPRNKLIDRIFWWIHKLWKGWAITQRVHPIKINPKTILQNARHFLKMEA
ncbi:radical SAM protein [Anaerolineales bacterium HSG24]|nr:radical SAM protein [Anaerolineales bacterium HSG24]